MNNNSLMHRLLNKSNVGDAQRNNPLREFNEMYLIAGQ